MKINWSYTFDQIKDRMFYIVGGIIIIFATSLNEWMIIGPTITKAQDLEIIPDNTRLALVLQTIVVMALFAISWDFLSGYSGQVSFGHALFFGMGGYISLYFKNGLIVEDKVWLKAMDDNIQEIGDIMIDFSVLLAIIYASVFVLLFAIVVAIFTLRLKGPYFALVTLVLPLIAQVIVTKIWNNYTGGDGGLTHVPNLVIQPNEDNNINGLDNYILQFTQQFKVFLVILAVCVLILYTLARSRYGLILKSIREDSIAASASGVNVNFYKVTSFGISAFFAAVAGGLFTQVNGSATSSFFEAQLSFEVIIFSILGGIGTITGPLVGTFILSFAVDVYLEAAFIEIPTLKTLSLGVILIIVLRYQPLGLTRANKQMRNSMVFAVFWAIFIAFYDAGEVLKSFSTRFTPAGFLINLFGENGIFKIDVNNLEGRLLIYYLIGMVIGYYGPDLFQKIRLRIWGVWPSLGKFDPPK